MISSRSLDDLDPSARTAAESALADCKAAGLDVLVYCTYRDFEEQNRLYASGRTTPGEWKTNARGGQSWHNWRLALDLVPLRNGVPVWGRTVPEDVALWKSVAEKFKAHGFEWGGDWPRAKQDWPHFQRPDGQTIAMLLAKHPKGLA